jgi:hypothetical protein
MTPSSPYKKLKIEAVLAVLAAGNLRTGFHLRSGHRKPYTVFQAIHMWMAGFIQPTPNLKVLRNGEEMPKSSVDRGVATIPEYAIP